MDMVPNRTPFKSMRQWLSQCSGKPIDPVAIDALFPEIEKHKYRLSAKLNRDVGMKVAALDYLENAAIQEPIDPDAAAPTPIPGWDARHIERSVWDTIADTQPPKQIVSKRIIMPLTRKDLARKHAVVPPRSIIFFGPPGTGKTHFVKAIAGILQWRFIEVSPSALMADGEDRLGANLKRLMEQGR